MSASGSVAALLASILAGHFILPSFVTRLADLDFRYSSGFTVSSKESDSAPEEGPEPDPCSCPEVEPLPERGLWQGRIVQAVDEGGPIFWIVVFVIVGHVVGFWAYTCCRCCRRRRDEEACPGGRAVRARISENGRARRPVHR